MTTYGYVRVSTNQQGTGENGNGTGLGLEAQEHTIRQWFAGSLTGGSLTIVREVGSGGKMRPELERILNGMGPGDTLVAAKTDRLTRSLSGMAAMLETCKDEGWDLVLLDLNLDTKTPNGRFTAGLFALIAQLERDWCSVRTKEALAAKLARDPAALERPVWRTDPDTVKLIHELHDSGMTLRAIASELDERGVKTLRGGKWLYGSVAYLLKAR